MIGMGGSDALMGYDTLLERANDDILMKIHFNEGTVLEGYRERQELEGYNRTEVNTIWVLRRFDHSVLKVKESGEIVLITSNARHHLNSIGMNLEIPHDKDYFSEIFGEPEERRSGVYTANFKEGKIWTKDDEGNILIVHSNGESVEKMAVSFDLD